IEFNNLLRSANILSNVEVWDLRTYRYEMEASRSVHTGSSMPPDTIEYSSNGYYGVLKRTSYINNRYQTDEGSKVTKVEKKTVTGTLSGWSESHYVYTASGWRLVWSDATNQPTMIYDQDGYYGILYKVSFTTDTDNGRPSGPGEIGQTYVWRRTYTGYYSGEVTKEVEIWVPNLVWHDDYTGFYTGTVSKEVKQPYVDPFRPTSKKYIIYITNDKLRDMNDLSFALNKSGAELILIGHADIRRQVGHDHFIENNRPIAALMSEALDIIADTGPAEKYTLLAGIDELQLSVADFDEENDPIAKREFLYVHDPDYFDNGSGLEQLCTERYSDNEGWVDTLLTKLNKPGKYTIYRRIKDDPSDHPAFDSFDRYSGTPFVEVYAHRKPVAIASLDWDYDAEENVYLTTWTDNSYDPDHQYSRADRGIVERKIMYRETGGEWNYTIPDKLKPGTYELYYYVKDPENTWSDPCIMKFTLEEAPPIQFNASLRTLDSAFSLEGIPASEELEAYDIWTRYPGDVKLEMALYNGALRKTPVKTVAFGSGTGTKVNNDIFWNNVIYTIPSDLPDGKYDFRIAAVADDGKSTAKSFQVTVSTPIGLFPHMPEELSGGATARVSAETSKYADTVSVTLFHGTPHARTFSLANPDGAAGSKKNWEGVVSVPAGIPDGEYTARFTATAPNGKTQSRDVKFSLTNMAITEVKLSGYWNHWRGQTDIFGKKMTVEPHRFLSLECVRIDIRTKGDPEKVVIRFSPELESMYYTDPNGHTYDYSKDFFGYYVRFPQDSTLTVTDNHAYWEYYLPLAPSTKNWDDRRLRPQYRMTVTAYKGDITAEYVIDDIDITGNIYDLTYIQPKR
ncbi:MAG TPA: hypothetical protein PK127_05940, partial [Clostridiales bacterium]|nr:hypothetical protein [Clostridiales bacterium]